MAVMVHNWGDGPSSKYVLDQLGKSNDVLNTSFEKFRSNQKRKHRKYSKKMAGNKFRRLDRVCMGTKNRNRDVPKGLEYKKKKLN